jgi:mono/diheme cytochrome c family protein
MQQTWRMLLATTLLTGLLATVTGRPGMAMPSWADRFSNEELWQLTAFVASLGDQARPGSQ